VTEKVSSKKTGQESAWREAETYGVDMSLLESNLKKSPLERIRTHNRALATALALRQGMKHRHGKS